MWVLDLNLDPHAEMTGMLLTEPSLQSPYPDFLESKVTPKERIMHSNRRRKRKCKERKD